MPEDSDLAGIVVRREDVPPELAVRLYRIVGEEVKKRVTARFPNVRDNVENSLKHAVVDMVESAQALPDPFLPEEALVTGALSAHDQGMLGIPDMLENLRGGKIKAFIAQCAVYTDLPCRTIAEILKQESGQGLAVLCRARDIDKSDFLTIYLLTGRMRKAEKVIGKAAMTRALGYYDRIQKPVAERILRNSRIRP